MAINPETQYPGKIAPATAQYPFGAARNITVPGDGKGTPWEAAIVNDNLGFQQSLLSEADLVPSGTPEQVGASQYLEALRIIAARASSTVFKSLADLQAGLDQSGKSLDLTKIPTARVLGFSTPNDGGAAEWRRDGTTGTANSIAPITGKFFDKDGDGWGYIFTIGPVAREVNPMAFGALADGASDSSAIFIGNLTFADVLLIPTSTLGFAARDVIVPDSKGVKGGGYKSKVIPWNSMNSTVFSLGNRSFVDNIRVSSPDGKDSALTNQNGIVVDTKFRSRVTNYWADGLGGAGYLCRDVVDVHQGNLISNYIFEACNIGLNADSRGEYLNATNGSITTCNVGMRIQAGNINGHGTVISDNLIGVEIVAGSNDAHGQLTGTLLNHNITRTIKVNAPANGFTFIGTQMFNGGDIELLNCSNIWFRGGVKQLVNVLEDGCTNCGFTQFDLIGEIGNTPNANASASEVFYLDCNIRGVAPSSFDAFNGGLLRTSQTVNQSGIGVVVDFTFDTIDFNAIPGNTAYTVQNFYNAGVVTGADSKVRPDSTLKLNSIISIGRDDQAVFDPELVKISLQSTASGDKLGFFQPVDRSSIGGTNFARYSFNGTMPRQNFKIVIDNGVGANVTVYADHDSALVLSNMEVTGW